MIGRFVSGMDSEGFCEQPKTIEAVLQALKSCTTNN
jgi:hypothetical protein